MKWTKNYVVAKVVLSAMRKKELTNAIYAREGDMLGAYSSVSTALCDLHDTPGQILEKKAIREIAEWERARVCFY